MSESRGERTEEDTPVKHLSPALMHTLAGMFDELMRVLDSISNHLTDIILSYGHARPLFDMKGEENWMEMDVEHIMKKRGT